jgi:hypothetical protein
MCSTACRMCSIRFISTSPLHDICQSICSWQVLCSHIMMAIGNKDQAIRHWGNYYCMLSMYVGPTNTLLWSYYFEKSKHLHGFNKNLGLGSAGAVLSFALLNCYSTGGTNGVLPSGSIGRPNTQAHQTSPRQDSVSSNLQTKTKKYTVKHS